MTVITFTVGLAFAVVVKFRASVLSYVVGVTVGCGVDVAVGCVVGVAVGCGVDVAVGCVVGVAVGCGVGVGVGAAMLIVTVTVTGLPATVFPVSGSMALIVTPTVKVEPPATPVALTMTFTDVFVPPARFVPEVAESETKLGAPEASAAVQFSGSAPVLLMPIGWEVVPVATLNVRLAGPAVSEGAASTLSATLTVCGLPVIVIPVFTAASEIESL